MARLTKEEREKACQLLKEGVKQKDVAKQLKTTRNTIHRLFKRITENGTTDDRPRTGRPRVMPTHKHTWLECSGSERPFVCRECAKTFKTFSNLKGHMKIHSEMPLFHCDQCGRGFVSLSGLQRHMRCHTGERPFICEYCAHGFADVGTLRTHLRLHTGERPFKCHLCGYACNTAGNLHNHMKVHRDNDGVVPKPINVKPSKSNAIPIFDYNKLLLDANGGVGQNGGTLVVRNGEFWCMEVEQHDDNTSGSSMKMENLDLETGEENVRDGTDAYGPGTGGPEDIEDEKQDQGGRRAECEKDSVSGEDCLEGSGNGSMLVVPNLRDSDDPGEIKREPIEEPPDSFHES